MLLNFDKCFRRIILAHNILGKLFNINDFLFHSFLKLFKIFVNIFITNLSEFSNL